MCESLDLFDEKQYYLIGWIDEEEHHDTADCGALTAEQARIFWAALKSKNIDDRFLNSGPEEFILELIADRIKQKTIYQKKGVIK